MTFMRPLNTLTEPRARMMEFQPVPLGNGLVYYVIIQSILQWISTFLGVILEDCVHNGSKLTAPDHVMPIRVLRRARSIWWPT